MALASSALVKHVARKAGFEGGLARAHLGPDGSGTPGEHGRQLQSNVLVVGDRRWRQEKGHLTGKKYKVKTMDGWGSDRGAWDIR